jgi:hypothetical protein
MFRQAASRFISSQPQRYRRHEPVSRVLGTIEHFCGVTGAYVGQSDTPSLERGFRTGAPVPVMRAESVL